MKPITSKMDLVCGRNIKTLHNFEPPATEDEIRASALQFVRKLSGFAHPLPGETGSHLTTRWIQVTAAAHELLGNPRHQTRPPRDRAVEAAKARAQSRGTLPSLLGAIKRLDGPALVYLKSTPPPALLPQSVPRWCRKCAACWRRPG